MPFRKSLSARTTSGDNAGMIAFAAWADTTGVDRTSGMALRIEPSATLGANAL